MKFSPSRFGLRLGQILDSLQLASEWGVRGLLTKRSPVARRRPARRAHLELETLERRDTPNAAPVMDSVWIDYTDLYTEGVLTAHHYAHDDDLDSLSYSYQWYKNSFAISGETSSTLDMAVAGNGDHDDSINVEVTAFDGTDYSSPLSDPSGVIVMNSNPVANDDGSEVDPLETDEDTSLVVYVRANDTDLDGDTLTLSDSWFSYHGGTYTRNANGTYTYAPAENFYGLDYFQYDVSDGLQPDSAYVYIYVNPVNDAPVAVDDDDALYTFEDTPFDIYILNNDSDVESETMTPSIVSGPSHGDVSITSGVVTYTPDANYYGEDSFTYKLHDGHTYGNTATVSFSIMPQNDDPVAVDDSTEGSPIQAYEDTPITIAVLTNDYDVDGDFIFPTTGSQNNGLISINDDGTITYTPNADFYGADYFTYVIYDGTPQNDTGYVYLYVNPVNDAPVAWDDDTGTYEDTPVVYYVLSNDTDPESDPLQVVGFSGLANGTATINANGSITYTPNANYFGTDSFQYIISDGQGGTATGNVTVTVTSVNDAPVAKPDWASVGIAGNVSIPVLLNDTDVEGDLLTLNIGTGPTYGTAEIDPNDSTHILYTADSMLDPFTIHYDSFTYYAHDGEPSNYTTVNMTITAGSVWATTVVNYSSEWKYSEEDWSARNALGQPNTYSDEDLETAWAPNPMNGDEGSAYYTPIGDPQNGTEEQGISYITVAFPSAYDAFGLLVRESSGNGFVVGVMVHGTGGDTYINVPYDDSPSGVVNDFVVEFGTSITGVSSVTIYVNINHDLEAWEEIDAVKLLTETAVPFSKSNTTVSGGTLNASLSEDGTFTWSGNTSLWDVATPGDNSTLVSIRFCTTGNGTVTHDNAGTPYVFSDDVFTYTPNPDFFGNDTFSFVITDDWGISVTKNVNVTIASVNDLPYTIDDYAVTTKNNGTSNGSITVNVTANDYDLETANASLSVSNATLTLGSGNVSFSGGNITFVPSLNFTGIGQIDYTMSDGNGGTENGSLTVYVYQTGQWASSVLVTSQYSTTDWSASMATGAPDTFDYGDANTSWAAAEADMEEDQELLVTFSSNATATGLLIRETNANGFVTKIQFLSDTNETLGTLEGISDPSLADHMSDTTFWLPTPLAGVRRARIFVNTSLSEDWEEIDAIRLLSTGSGNVSTTYSPNQKPVAGKVVELGEVNQSLTIDPLALAGDADGDTLSISLSFGGVVSPSHGNVTVSNGTLIYTPTAGYSGNDTFTYQISDGHGGMTVGTANLTITAGVYASVIQNVSSEANAGAGLLSLGTLKGVAGGWAPGTGAANETITLGVTPTAATSILVREGGSEGFITKVEVQLEGNSTFITYWSGTDTTNPLGDFPNFIVSNGNITDPIQAIRITVNGTLDGQIDVVKLVTALPPTLPSAPTAANVSISTREDVPVHIVPSTTGSRVSLAASAPSHGTVYVDVGTTPLDPSDDYLRYVPDADYHGTDSFTYTVIDSFGRKATATANITISSVNDTPLAMDDFGTTGVDEAVIIDVLGNDSDADDDTITVTGVSNGTHGNVTLSNGTVTYTPAGGYVGSDAFTYTISDGNNGTMTARVFVQTYEAGVWAESLREFTTQASSTDGAATKIVGAADSDAWIPTGENQIEFVTVRFNSTPITATGLIVRETGGAIDRIEYRANGSYATLWDGTDPTSSSEFSDFTLRFNATIDIKDVRIYLDNSKNASNAIDAVRLLTGNETLDSTMSLSTRGFDASGHFSVTEYSNATLPSEVNTYFRGLLAQTVTSTYTGSNLTQQDTALVLGFNNGTPITRTTRLTFDANTGLTLSQILGFGAANATTTYQYDGRGRMISLLDPVGNNTTWSYNDTLSTITQTDATGNQTVTQNDSQGRITSVIDANNRRRAFTYNDDGTKATETWQTWDTDHWEDGDEFVYTYANGLLVSALKNGEGYTYTYDSQGYLIHAEQPIDVNVGNSTVPFTMGLGYDQSGYRNLVIDAFGTRQASIYNYAGQLLVRISTQDGGPTLRIDQEYDAYGRVVKQSRYSDADGETLVVTTTYEYDVWSGQVTDILTTDDEDATISEFTYAYDFGGQLIGQTEFQAAVDVTPREMTYTYDDQGQLAGDGTDTWSYDANGNRDYGDYTTDLANRVLSDGTWDYTYDNDGNMTGKVATDESGRWEYIYDHRNQLIEANEYDDEDSLVLHATYQYDVFGNRIGKTIDTYAETPSLTNTSLRACLNNSAVYPETDEDPFHYEQRYAQDGWNNLKASPIGLENWDVWADISADGSLAAQYMRGDVVDQIFGRVDGSDPYWYLTDHLGSVRDILDSEASVADSLRYSGFGAILGDETEVGARGRYAWTGREYDVETDLQYNRARYFDPQTGRWISQDPLGYDAGDSNLYRYVANQPLVQADPSGLQVQFNPLQGPLMKDVRKLINDADQTGILVGGPFTAWSNAYKFLKDNFIGMRAVSPENRAALVLFYFEIATRFGDPDQIPAFAGFKQFLSSSLLSFDVKDVPKIASIYQTLEGPVYPDELFASLGVTLPLPNAKLALRTVMESRLIPDLDSDSFSERAAASRKLRDLAVADYNFVVPQLISNFKRYEGRLEITLRLGKAISDAEDLILFSPQFLLARQKVRMYSEILALYTPTERADFVRTISSSKSGLFRLSPTVDLASMLE